LKLKKNTYVTLSKLTDLRAWWVERQRQTLKRASQRLGKKEKQTCQST
jgi:hypothetical protein